MTALYFVALFFMSFAEHYAEANGFPLPEFPVPLLVVALFICVSYDIKFLVLKD